VPTPDPVTTPTDPLDELRSLAVERLEKRIEFRDHLFAYVLVNTMLVVIWFLVADGGLFWPVFPVLGWGIGVFFHALETYRRPLTDEHIAREMERLAPTAHAHR
jgi:uncharacterized membrane protein